MKRYFLFLLIIFLSSCSKYTPAPALAAGVGTGTPVPTRSPIPSATVGYQETAVVAQQTAMEAVRVNAGITAEFEQRLQEQLQITAAAEQRNFEVLAWTQISMPTVIPMTGTQQAINNTQVAGRASLEAGHMTGTAVAPTLMVAIANSEIRAKHAQTDYIINMVGVSGVAFFMVAAGLFLVKKTVTMKMADFMQETEPEKTREPNDALGTIVTISERRNGTDHMKRYVVPCTPEQFTELAESLTQGQRTLAINQWEGKGTLFTRPVILLVRAWARENNFAVSTDDGQLAPTNEFLTFLIGWLEKRELQEGFQFEETPHSPEV